MILINWGEEKKLKDIDKKLISNLVKIKVFRGAQNLQGGAQKKISAR